MKKQIFFLTLLFAFLLSAQAVFALTGKVIKIADGDTITILTDAHDKVKVRLYGIDTPERKQAFGRRASQFTAQFLKNDVVDVEIMDTDRYGRVVGIVKDKGKILNEELLKAGLAWVYTTYCRQPALCDRWKEYEYAARKAKKGLWADPSPVAPWEWRKSKRSKKGNF